jgi:hypothetical protein
MKWRSFARVAFLTALIAPTARSEGYRTSVGSGDEAIPVIVVRGTPYEMGLAHGKLMAAEARRLLEGFLRTVRESDPVRYGDEALDAAWEAVRPFTSARYQDELRGLAEGAGLPPETVRRAHMVPVVSNYSCSSLAAWGSATRDGHLYQTRDLDWNLQAHAHDTPCLAVYLPDAGIPHINVTFAGCIGVNTGMNARGIVLSEMGDSPGSDYPYKLDGEPFMSLFRDILYDAGNLDQAVRRVQDAKRIKKYHYVIGDGRGLRAVKMRAHAPDLVIWKDDDPADELAPRVLKDVVYQDEGRGAFEPLRQAWGKIDADTLREIACAIPIRGHNVLDVVYDATALELWVSYARLDVEAYKQPFVHVKLADYLTYDPRAAHASATWPAPLSAPDAR